MINSIKNHRNLLFATLLIAEILLMVYITWQYGAQWLDSDDSAEMILAELLSREGGILSKNWYYSTELRVFNTQLVMAPLFCLFSDWHVVRTVGTGILLVILLSSYLFFCRSVSLGKSLIYLAPLIVWPFSFVYLDFVLYGLYYIPHLVIIFLSLGLCLNDSPKQTLRLCALIALSFVAGLGGLRMVAVCYIPLVAAAFVSLFPRFRSNNLVATKFFFRSLFAVMAAFAGLGVNYMVLTKSYSFVTMSFLHLVSPHWGKMVSVIKSIPSFLGMVRPDFSSPSVVVFLFGGLFCLILCLMSFRLIKHWRSLSQETQILLAYFLFSVLITVSAPLISTQGWKNRYMILPGIGYLVIIAAYIDWFKSAASMKKILCVFILITELFAGFYQCFTFAQTKKLPTKNAAFAYILNSGMKFGFGDWDTSDVLTELSSGRIHLCKIFNFKHMYAWYWLMEKDFQKYAKGEPVFLIIANERFSYNGGVPHIWGSWVKEDLTYLDEGKRVFQDQHYTVWCYDSYEQFESLVGRKF